MDRLLSRGLADLVGPAMDDRVAVEFIEVGDNPGFELGFGGDTDVAEHRSRHLREEALDKIEPRPVFRREHEAETALWLAGNPGLGLLGDMGGMIVEDQFDGGISRVGGIEPLEEADELARAMAVLNRGVDLSSKQVDP